ncbi:hypothetical protein Tco_1220084 [Tanacetum coccineum]
MLVKHSVMGWINPQLPDNEMMIAFINNIHVDYAELLWEGLYYSLHYLTSLIPYPRFTKIIISHYMTNFPEISRRAKDIYHNLKDDDIMKYIFNLGRYKDRVGIKIPDWICVSNEMKHTEHYRMTNDAPRLPNPKVDAGESSALKRSTVIRFCIPQRRSTRLTPPAPVPTVDKANEMILQDTLQVSLAEHKSQEEQEARENVELVNKHLASVEIEKMVEESENVIDDSPIPRNDDQNIPGTRLEPRIDKESPKVEITNVVIPVNVNEEEEITDEEVMVESLPIMVDKHIKEQVEKQVLEKVKVQVPVYVAKGLLLERNYMSGHILHVHPTQPQTTFVPEQQYQLTYVVRPRDQDDPHDNAPPEGDNSAKRQKTSEYEAYVTGESSGQVNESEQSPSSSGNQEQVDDYDFGLSQLKKITDGMLRQRCTSGDEHQYHIDQMKNFLKLDIVEESRRNSWHLTSTKDHTSSLKAKGNSGPEKIVLSLHKFPAIIFNDVDIEERTSRWVNKCVKKFNPYARYGVEHWKNPHVKIFYIKRQKEPEKPKEVVYSNSKIISSYSRRYWELGP